MGACCWPMTSECLLYVLAKEAKEEENNFDDDGEKKKKKKKKRENKEALGYITNSVIQSITLR